MHGKTIARKQNTGIRGDPLQWKRQKYGIADTKQKGGSKEMKQLTVGEILESVENIKLTTGMTDKEVKALLATMEIRDHDTIRRK